MSFKISSMLGISAVLDSGAVRQFAFLPLRSFIKPMAENDRCSPGGGRGGGGGGGGGGGRTPEGGGGPPVAAAGAKQRTVKRMKAKQHVEFCCHLMEKVKNYSETKEFSANLKRRK